jgi:putative ABC transport system permease protein
LTEPQEKMLTGKFLHIMAGSLRTLRRFPLRSGLTLLSAVLGVGGVISTVNYAAEGRLKVVTQIRSLGTNVLTVTPQQSRSVGGRAKTGSIVTTLTPQDYAEIRRDVSEIERSSATATSSFLVKSGDLSKSNCVVVGVEPDYVRIKNWPVSDGEMFGEPELRRSARVAVLGATVRRDIFGDVSPLGQRLFINRVPFEVVGALAERGQSLDAGNEDNQVYVPLTTMMHRLTNVDYFSAIFFEAASWNSMDSATEGIHRVLRKKHRAIGNLPEDFQIQSQKSLISTEIASSERLAFLVRWVGLSGLVVSGLGILAMCWIAVGERTGEIGTRRAVGATQSDVFFQFLFEACVISVLGCGTGLLVGWWTTEGIAQRASLPFFFDWPSAAIAIGIAVALNLVFAIIPSRRAALLDPIRALRSE